ncbi:hypothetical protein FA10DRAFT_285861 [Acaromyces ingoldii]|uniref:Uncharacterized protein n=1 Tax=Acaromyces ingoldii TaxID=215250 RepID=A0A316YL83_9BASI|nr:hypothetical protein FA10DRAFT_285861 [Acaromyces ingoldii]PWN90147.1 hypothetical protein FA10DRAFT_285861 [Acaromyces ingoldii]
MRSITLNITFLALAALVGLVLADPLPKQYQSVQYGHGRLAGFFRRRQLQQPQVTTTNQAQAQVKKPQQEEDDCDEQQKTKPQQVQQDTGVKTPTKEDDTQTSAVKQPTQAGPTDDKTTKQADPNDDKTTTQVNPTVDATTNTTTQSTQATQPQTTQLKTSASSMPDRTSCKRGVGEGPVAPHTSTGLILPLPSDGAFDKSCKVTITADGSRCAGSAYRYKFYIKGMDQASIDAIEPKDIEIKQSDPHTNPDEIYAKTVISVPCQGWNGKIILTDRPENMSYTENLMGTRLTTSNAGAQMWPDDSPNELGVEANFIAPLTFARFEDTPPDVWSQTNVGKKDDARGYKQAITSCLPTASVNIQWC